MKRQELAFRHLEYLEAAKKLTIDNRLVMAAAQAAGASTSTAAPGYEEEVEVMVANIYQGQIFVGAQWPQSESEESEQAAGSKGDDSVAYEAACEAAEQSQLRQ